MPYKHVVLTDEEVERGILEILGDKKEYTWQNATANALLEGFAKKFGWHVDILDLLKPVNALWQRGEIQLFIYNSQFVFMLKCKPAG